MPCQRFLGIGPVLGRTPVAAPSGSWVAWHLDPLRPLDWEGVTGPHVVLFFNSGRPLYAMGTRVGGTVYPDVQPQYDWCVNDVRDAIADLIRRNVR